MSIAPEGLLSLPFAHCETLLAHCPTFQAAVGVDNAAAAKAFIHFEENDLGEVDIAPPFALLGDADGLLTGQLYYDLQHGELRMQLVFAVSTAEDLTAKERFFDRRNKPGKIIEEMLERARTTIPDDADGNCFWDLSSFRKVQSSSDNDPEQIEFVNSDNEPITVHITEFLLKWGGG